jgi:hypothetical protein
LARFSVVCPLGGHAKAMAFCGTPRCGRWCMYGPNYVKLSRVCAMSYALCSCLVCLLGTMPHQPRARDPLPVGPTSMPSPPSFASPSPRHKQHNTHCSRFKPQQWQPRHVRAICVCISERFAYPRPALRTYVWSTPSGYGCATLAPRSQTMHCNTRCSRLGPRHWLARGMRRCDLTG